MRDDGFILLWRRFFNHRYWTERRRYNRAEAWIDLIGMAAFREREVLIGQQKVRLGRGEFLASLRYLERRWDWSVKTVRAFLETAVLDSELTLRGETSQGHIYRIVKYDEYQDSGHRGTRGAQKVTQLSGEVSTNNVESGHRVVSEKGTKKKEEKEVKQKTTSCSKRAGELWTKHMGGKLPQVRMNVAFKPLVEEHGEAEVLHWWEQYLTSPKMPAQTKTPENFASRFGAWRREQSVNGKPSAADFRRCLKLGGSCLPIPEVAETGFQNIAKEDPALWERVKGDAPQVDWTYLAGFNGNEYQLNRAIDAEIKRLHDN